LSSSSSSSSSIARLGDRLHRLGVNIRAVQWSFKDATELDGTSGICGLPFGGHVEANYVYMYRVYLSRNPSELFKNEFASSVVKEECILLFVVKKCMSGACNLFLHRIIFQIQFPSRRAGRAKVLYACNFNLIEINLV
jgi:hypothetical protein